MPLLRRHWHSTLHFCSNLDFTLWVFRLARKFLESTRWNCFGEAWRGWSYSPGLSAGHPRWSAACAGAARLDAGSAQPPGSQLWSAEVTQGGALQVTAPSQGCQSFSVHGRSWASRRSRWPSAQTTHQGSAKLQSVNWSEESFLWCTKAWEVVQTLGGITADFPTTCDLWVKILSYWDLQSGLLPIQILQHLVMYVCK